VLSVSVILIGLPERGGATQRAGSR
jgi:hypothetical protein